MKKNKYDISHLLPTDPLLDEHLRWKFLKSKVKQYKKRLADEIDHFNVYPTEPESNPQMEMNRDIELISKILEQSDTTEKFRIHLLHSEISQNNQANLLLLDPEESVKLSFLRAKIECRLKHSMMPKSLRDSISFLHQKAKHIDDLFVLAQTLMPEKWRNELPDLLTHQSHRSFTPLFFSHEPKFGENTFDEVERIFSAHSDYLSTCIKINGKQYHCPGNSSVEFLNKFIEALNNEGWKPTLEPVYSARIAVDVEETPFSNFLKALAFNTLTQSLMAHKQHFSDQLAKQFKVQQIKKNRIFSIYFKSSTHFTVIRKFTWDVRQILQDQTFGYSVLLYHMFTTLSFHNGKWSEALFIQNVTILDSSQQKFLEATFKSFEKWIQTAKH